MQPESPNLAVISPDETLARFAHAVDADARNPHIAESTHRAYDHDAWDFADLCTRFELCALPAAPQTVALYLKHLQERGLAVP